MTREKLLEELSELLIKNGDTKVMFDEQKALDHGNDILRLVTVAEEFDEDVEALADSVLNDFLTRSKLNYDIRGGYYITVAAPTMRVKK